MMELMVVIAIILVLIGMAAGRYEKSVVRAREAVLKQDLTTMRNAIQQYTLDKAAGPQSLDDLVSSGYLREVPTDPMTRARGPVAPGCTADSSIARTARAVSVDRTFSPPACVPVLTSVSGTNSPSRANTV